MPAKKTNPGAQKCVTQRVKKTPAAGPPAGTPEKTRTWSMAISTMTAPRSTSMEATRFIRRQRPIQLRNAAPLSWLTTTSSVAGGSSVSSVRPLK